MTTIFSKIIDREVPAEIVFEDDQVIAILDINPVHPGHTLVIPKKFSVNGLDCDPEGFAYLMHVGQKIAQAQIASLPCDGVNFIMNNGAAAGQEVFHTHLHVVPRYTNDHSFSKPTHLPYDQNGPGLIAEKLRSAIN